HDLLQAVALRHSGNSAQIEPAVRLMPRTVGNVPNSDAPQLLWLLSRYLIQGICANGMHQHLAVRRSHAPTADHVDAVRDQTWSNQLHTAAVCGRLGPQDGRTRAIEFGRSIRAGVFVAEMLDSIGRQIAGGRWRDWLGERNAKALRQNVDGLHFKW